MARRPPAFFAQLCSAAIKTASVFAAAVVPAYLLTFVFAFPAFFVIASLVIVLGAGVLWWIGRSRSTSSGRIYAYLAFTLALLALVWEPMISLHAQYAPDSLSFLVNNLSYGIAGLVLIGLAFIRVPVNRKPVISGQ